MLNILLAAALGASMTLSAAPVPHGDAATSRPTTQHGKSASALPIVPAYFDPAVAPRQWDRLIATTPAGGMVVFSVGNLGPGRSVDRAYLDVVRRMQDRGILAICYVETKKANGVGVRPLARVKRDVRRCFDQYSPDGIFLDEVDGSNARFKGVAKVSNYIHERDAGALRILNAGQNTSRKFLRISDVLAIFEGPWDSSPLGYNFKDWRPSAWVTDWIETHPGGERRFWYMTYDTTAADLVAAVDRTRRLGGGYFYATDGAGDPRWDHLPPYWESELVELARVSRP